jgi:hypothetical protein
MVQDRHSKRKREEDPIEGAKKSSQLIDIPQESQQQEAYQAE